MSNWFITNDGCFVNGRGEAVGFNPEEEYIRTPKGNCGMDEMCCECPKMGECDWR